MKRDLKSYAGFTLEAIFAEFLMQHMSVLWAGNVRHSSGRGPRMSNSQQGVIIADYLVAGQFVQGWIDLKAKSTSGKRRDRNRSEQMIDTKAFNNYLELFKTGTQVYLIFLEVDTGGIFMGHLYNIATSQYVEDDVLFGVPVKRFDRSALTFIGRFNVPDGDLRKTRFEIKWDRIQTMMVQLPIPLEYA